MALTINPISPVTVAAQGAAGGTPTLVLQPGTVVSAQVQNVLAADLVRIAIADLSIDVVTQVPLQAGQNLQLAVSQADNGVVRLAVVGQGAGAASADAASLASDVPIAASPAQVAAPSNDPLTPLQRIAVSVASEHAAAQQQSLAPLFADLNAVASSGSLPPGLRAAVAQVLAQQTGLDDNLTGADIQQALQKSGLFLEASLAAGTTPAGSIPDLKAALIVLRQALATVAGNAENPAATQPAISGQTAGAAKPTATPASPGLAPSLPTDGEALDVRLPLTQPGIAQSVTAQQAPAGTSSGLLLANALSNGPQSVASAIALSVLQEALPGIRRVAGDASVMAANEAQGEGIGTRLTTPPPFRGALPSAQPIAAPSIVPDAPLGSIAHRLLDDTDAAIARQTLLQVASLPDRTDASSNPVDASVPRWNFEIPFATPQGTAMAQFEIARDGGGRDSEAAQRIWQARFSLDVEPAGPVHALITLSGERTSVRMWAERPATAALLRAGANELSRALSAAELQPGDIVIRDGAPPQPKSAKRGHFLDRAS
jgi:hypothetical protein